MKNVGHCELTVSITPDHLYQEHSFIFDLDQSYLPPLLKSLELIMHSYPLKGMNHPLIDTANGANNGRGIIKRFFEAVQCRIKRAFHGCS